MRRSVSDWMCIASSRRSRSGRTGIVRSGRSDRDDAGGAAAVRRQPRADGRGRDRGDVQHARDRAGCSSGRSRGWSSRTRMKTRAIAEAKVKTDKVDAQVLAQLLAADYLPAVWLADDETQALRRQVARRAHIVRQRTRLKNQVQSILHRNLMPRCPAADLFGHKGRRWLAEQELAGRRAAGGRGAAAPARLPRRGAAADRRRARAGRAAPRGGQAADDDPRRRRDRRALDRRRGRRLRAASARPTSWSATSGSTRGCASPAGSRPRTDGSPSRAARTHAGCSSRPPGPRPRLPGPLRAFYERVRCPARACRSRSSRPRASSPCSAGT